MCLFLIRLCLDAGFSLQAPVKKGEEQRSFIRTPDFPMRS